MLILKTIAKETKLPVMLYNVPGRTGANVSAETTIALSQDVENITCIKEASGNLIKWVTLLKMLRMTSSYIVGMTV